MIMRRRIVFGLISASVVAGLPAAAAGTGPAEFLSDGDGRIVRRAADGSVVGTVATSGDRARWSPDGTRIAFRKRQEGGGEILVAEVGGEARRIWASAAIDTDVEELSWSPDGQLIAFIRAGSGGEDVFTVPAAGGSTRRLTTTAGSKSRLAWQPSGRLVLYEWQPGPLSKPSPARGSSTPRQR
jgi:Tol biopolymer transport system component